MKKEELKNGELPSQVLFHGTTIERFITFFRPDGSYKDPQGGLIWLDEELMHPLETVNSYHEQHNSDGFLLMVRTDLLTLQKPPNTNPLSPIQITTSHYWTTPRLPAGSFIGYNITKDPQRLFTNTPTLQHHLDGITKLCEPIKVVPDYVQVFRQIITSRQ